MTVALYLPGDIPIYAFPVILAAGASLGLLWVAWRTPQAALSRVDAGITAGLSGLLGARIGFVAVHWEYFASNPWESLQFYRGGLAWSGAAAGSLLGLWIFARLTRNSPLDLLDDLLPLGVTLTIFTWLGCWLDGCAYGPVAPNNWWGIPSIDQWGQVSLRWPIQLFGAVLALGLIWAIDQARPSLPQPGLPGSLGVFGLFFQILALSFLRADPAATWAGLRLDSWAALVLVVLSLALVLWLLRKPRLADSPSSPQATGPA